MSHNFRIRTITAGINLLNIDDIDSLKEAIHFLKDAKMVFMSKGYEVQTIRLATQNLYEIINKIPDERTLRSLNHIDQICSENDILIAIGEIIPRNQYSDKTVDWVKELIEETSMISFNVSIASEAYRVQENSIKMAAKITQCLAQNSKGGEANFRFTASANCPANVPYFPTAYHEGEKCFGIGLESANLVQAAFEGSNWRTARANLKRVLEKAMRPIEALAFEIEKNTRWKYNGIDASTAPGLESSIGAAIETLTQVPFGSVSTLSACALITDVLKDLDVKTCGYSGLMLPVIEDKILAQRAIEKRFSVEELLFFSTVSGTGLDVVPIPGDTAFEVLENLYRDVATLSLKYSNKILSARLFPIPGKAEGDMVEFDNQFLTPCRVMGLR